MSENTENGFATADIREIRRKNMKRLIEEAKTQLAFARLVGTSPAYVSQILSEKGRGEIGDRFARNIERGFNRPRGWLDRDSLVLSANAVPLALDKDVLDLKNWNR